MLLSVVQWQRVHRVRSDLDAVTARIYSCWNCGATNVAPTQKHRLLLSSKRRAHVRVWERINILVLDLEETGDRNDCADVDQQQFHRRTNWRSRHVENFESNGKMILNYEEESIWKITVVVLPRYYINVCPERLRKTTTNLYQDKRCPDWNSNGLLQNKNL
jgi:hypothetical protein